MQIKPFRILLLRLISQYRTDIPGMRWAITSNKLNFDITLVDKITANTKIYTRIFRIFMTIWNLRHVAEDPVVFEIGGSWNESHSGVSFCLLKED